MMLGQNDPYLKTVRQQRPTLFVVVVISLLGLALCIFGIEDTIHNPQIYLRGIFTTAPGILMIIAIIYLFTKNRSSTRLWPLRIQRRQIAIHDPERFLAASQPQPIQECPQPAGIGLSIKEITFRVVQGFFFSFLITTVNGWGSTSPWNSPHKLIFLIVVTGVLSPVLIWVFTYLTRKSSGKKPAKTVTNLEITEQGITTRYGAQPVTIDWQDARMFITYTTINTKRRQVRIYEILSENEVARWNYYPQPRLLLNVTPKMSQHDYDLWMQQAIGYIREQTGLPLIDVDRVPINNSVD